MPKKNNKNNITWEKSLFRFAIFFSVILGILICLILFFVFNSYCEKNDNQCADLHIVSIPNDISSGLIGSFTGALFTFFAFYIFEGTKRRIQPKPKIEVSFEPNQDAREDEKFRELVVKCNPHYVYRNFRADSQEVGEASYLRVKVTNEGNIVARNCRAYLTKVEKKQDNEWVPLEGYEDFMPLLWAYEPPKDYFVQGSGLNIPSKVSSYADILVSYEKCIKPDYLINKEPDKWFLKLKTNPQPTKHANILGISKSTKSEFKLTIEVYGDECLPKDRIPQISIILDHDKDNEKYVKVYKEKDEDDKEKDEDDKDKKAHLPLHSSLKIDELENKTDKSFTINHIYELL